VFINFAAAFYNVIENAESMAISQSGKTMLVITYKLLSVISHFFQTFNVCIGKHHLSLFTAYSAVRTTHDQIYSNFLIVVFANFH